MLSEAHITILFQNKEFIDPMIPKIVYYAGVVCIGITFGIFHQ